MRLETLADVATGRRRRAVIAVSLLAIVLLGLGLPGVVLDTTLDEFRGGTTEHAADAYIDEHLSGQAPNSTVSVIVIRDDENVLTRERYVEQLEAQQAIREHERIGPTLVDDQQPLGVANAPPSGQLCSTSSITSPTA